MPTKHTDAIGSRAVSGYEKRVEKVEASESDIALAKSSLSAELNELLKQVDLHIPQYNQKTDAVKFAANALMGVMIRSDVNEEHLPAKAMHVADQQLLTALQAVKLEDSHDVITSMIGDIVIECFGVSKSNRR